VRIRSRNQPSSIINKPSRGVNINNLKILNKGRQDYLTIGCVNARSLRNKTCDFFDNITDDNYDICMITETWLDNSDGVLQVEATPSGYCFQHLPRKGRTGGGVGLICTQNMRPQQIQPETSWKSFEHCEWVLTCGTHKILAVVIYRPPYSDKNRSTVNDFLNDFSTYMESVITTPHKLLIGGDFNIHMEDSQATDSNKFMELLDGLNLKNHVWVPTHERGHTLDLLITRNCNDIILDQPRVTSFLSDHAFIQTHANLPRSISMTKDIKFR
jgi:exonuclease III